MVGGKVVEIIQDVKDRPDVIWVNTEDDLYGDTCAIYIEKDESSLDIKLGDIIWWRGPYAMWTPQSPSSVYEEKLRRVGFSGVSRPEEEDGS